MNPTPEELARRIAELEQELARVAAAKDRLQESFNKLADIVFPLDPNWTPPPVEETVDAWAFLAELEAKYTGGPK